MAAPVLPWTAPDYNGDSLTAVLPSAVAVLTRNPPRLPLPRADRVVVLLVDGLGEHLLPAALPHAPFLAAMEPVVAGGLDAAFPSTTAASITSFGTGLPPGRHGIVGASFWLPELDGVLFPLGWRDRPAPELVQPEQTVLAAASASGIAVATASAREFAGSGLTRSALHGGRYVGADSPGEVVIAVSQSAAAAPPALVYGYFPAADKSAHIHGVGSPQWAIDMAHIDLAIAEIAERLPRGTLLLITGDHGMVNCPDEDRINIDGADFARGVRRIAGEPRMRHIYVRPDWRAEHVAERWQDLLGPAAVVLTREQSIAAGLFGPVRHDVAPRIGDVLALPTGTSALVSERVDSVVSGLRGQHGGLSDEERRVPLLGWLAG